MFCKLDGACEIDIRNFAPRVCSSRLSYVCRPAICVSFVLVCASIDVRGARCRIVSSLFTEIRILTVVSNSK